MGIYSETLLEKARRDANIERRADEILCRAKEGVPTLPPIEAVCQAVGDILRRFHIEPGAAGNCESTEEVLDALLDPEGIMYEKIVLTDNQWKQQANLILAFSPEGEPVILSPSLWGYRCDYPVSGHHTPYRKNMSLEPYAYMIFRPLNKGRFSLWHFIKLMLQFVSFKDILCLILSTALVSALGLVSPEINRYVLGDFLNTDSGSTAYAIVVTLAFVYVFAALLKGLFSILKNLLLSGMKLRITTQMQTAVVSKVLLMPYDYFLNESVGKQSVQIRNAKELTELLLDFFMNNLLSVAFAVMYIPQMKKLSSALLLPALLILALQILASILLCLASAQNSAKLIGCQQASASLLYELLKGIQKIHGIGAGRRAYAMVAEHYRKVLDASLEPPLPVRLNSTILSMISSLGTLALLIFAAAQGVTRTDYIAFTASYGLISSSVNSLVSMSKAIITLNPRIMVLKQLFDYQSPVPDGRRYVRALHGNINLENVSFAYPDQEGKGCVDHISLQIRRGEKIAIVGESGCGKSTLLKLILGLLSPDSGSILFDGLPLSSFNQRSFRKRIGSVFQFSRVFPGTILDNIAFTSPHLSIEEAWAAAEAAGIAEDIRNLPMGMETEISEGNGGGLSGGQKQRILIARALAQKPSVLILDEATSALDNISQHHVLSSIYALPCTVIMVAHRLSSVKDCDRIIMLKNGKIAEEGNYASLMEKDGDFAELVKKQQASA